MRKKKTHEEYVEELAEKNSMIEVIEQYVGAKIPILHRCKIDGHMWKASPTNTLRGHGCPVCSNNIKRTHDQYVCDVADINPFIEVVGKYINANTSIMHRCKIDGHVWYAAPFAILRGDRCPKCTKNAKKTTNVYVEELEKINPNIEVLEDYINAATPIAHRCKIDGNIWNLAP